MNLRFRKLRSRLFSTAAGASLLLLIFNLSNGYLSLDTPQYCRVGSWELTWDSPYVTVHRVSSAEETYRQQVENRAIVELWFEGLRTAVDFDIQRLPWNSEPYLAAKARYEIWHEAHAAYERVRMAPGQNWIRNDRIYSLGPLCVILGVLPLVWCIVFWQRMRERFAHRMIRWFQWMPADRIGWVARARRAAFACISLISLLLAFAIAVMWIRSHYTGDNYIHTETVGTPGMVGYNRFAIYTFVGGISFEKESISPVPPRNQSAIVFMTYSQAVSRIYSDIPQQGRPPKPAWTRPNPGPPMRGPWYGVKVNTPPRPIPGIREYSIELRWWVPFAIFCLLPTFWLFTHLRFRPLPATGYCFTCGYNLTGNTSGVCSECGTAIPTGAGASRAPLPAAMRVRSAPACGVSDPIIRIINASIRRRLFAVASALSMLLFVIAVVMWIWTARSRRQLTFWRHGTHYELLSRRGYFGIDNQPAILDLVRFRSNRVVALVQGLNRHAPMTFEEHAREHDRVAALLKATSALQPPARVQYLVPYWPVASCLAILPAIWLVRLRRQRSRRMENHCLTCRYDLTANTSGICPECGTAVPLRA